MDSFKEDNLYGIREECDHAVVTAGRALREGDSECFHGPNDA